MPDREKVIKGLECCIKRNPDDKTRCGECPYDGACLNRLKADALALLKAQGEEIEELKQEIEGHKDNLRETLDEMMRYADELKAQEPVKPIVDIDTWKCGNCGHTLEHQQLLGDNVLFHEQYDYCPMCGKAVKWE